MQSTSNRPLLERKHSRSHGQEVVIAVSVVAVLGVLLVLALQGDPAPKEPPKKPRPVVRPETVKAPEPKPLAVPREAPLKRTEAANLPEKHEPVVVSEPPVAPPTERPIEKKAEPPPEKRDPTPEPIKSPLGRLVSLTLDTITRKPSVKPYIQVGKEQWQICGGDAQIAKIARWGKIQDLPWEALPPEGLYKAFSLLAKSVDDRLVLAEFALGANLAEEAFSDLSQIAKERPAAKTQINEILARALGEPVPPGGYAWFRNRWVSEAQKDEILAREAMNRIVTDFMQLKQVAEARLQVRKDLRELQRRAVGFINSESSYGGGEGQADVEDLVGRVRAIWNAPYDHLQKHYPEWTASFRTALDRLIPAGMDREELERLIAQRFNIREFPEDGADKVLIEQNRKVLDVHRRMWSLLTPEERELLGYINDYRHLLGLPVGAVDELLALASRHHCAEMTRLDYFGHGSPVPKRAGPGDRAREEGTDGGAENCAGGDTPKGIFGQWYRSDAHHRHMIGGDVIGPGIHGPGALQTKPDMRSPSSIVKKELLMPSWLVEMRPHPVGSETRIRYLQLRGAVLQWLAQGENPEAIRDFRAHARTFLPMILKELPLARGPWLGVLLSIAGELHARDALDGARAALDSEDPWIRYLAAETLGTLAELEEAEPVREGGTMAEGAPLSEPAAKRITRRLIELLVRETHEAVIAATLMTLVKMGTPEGVEAVRKVRATASSWRLRYWAVEALARAKEGDEALTLALQDERRTVRERAARFVTARDNPALDALIESSKGKPGEYLLLFHAGEKHRPLLIAALLGHPDPEVRLHAGAALRRMGDPEAEKALLKSATADSVFEVRWFSWRALLKIAPGTARPLLTEAAARESNKDRRARLEELLK